MPMPMYFPEKYPQTWICCSQTGGNFLLAKVGEALYNNPCFRAISSAEVALPSHGRGRWFEPSIAHHVNTRVSVIRPGPFFFARTHIDATEKCALKLCPVTTRDCRTAGKEASRRHHGPNQWPGQSELTANASSLDVLTKSWTQGFETG